jgi:uncharacterized membrane protein
MPSSRRERRSGPASRGTTDPRRPLVTQGPGTPREREAERLEAFSDGVMAVIITIMAFSLPYPTRPTLAALQKTIPFLLIYVLSFAFVGIYWNNHHHLLRATDRISAAVMWANLNLLFWLSLVPFMTRWVSTFYRSHLPASAYGVMCLLAAVAYTILSRSIIRVNGPDSDVARAIGSDRKGNVSVVLYVAAVGLAWISPFIAYALYATVSIIWFIPDRRLDPHSSRGPAPGPV